MENKKTKIYKQWWFWLLIIIVCGIAAYFITTKLSPGKSNGGQGATQEETSKTSSSSLTEEEKIMESAVPAEVKDEITPLSDKLDELTKTAQGFIDNPSTYTKAAYDSFTENYTNVLSQIAEVGKTIADYGEKGSEWDNATSLQKLSEKNDQLTLLLMEFPKEFAQ